MVAVDVGYGQLAWSLRTDDRVSVLDRTNVRDLTPEAIGGPVDLVVADLSFISLRLVLPALAACADRRRRPAADGQAAVRGRPGPARARAASSATPRCAPRRCVDVAAAAAERGSASRGVAASPLPGPAGNVEYFLWLRRDGPTPRGRRRAGHAGPCRNGPA